MTNRGVFGDDFETVLAAARKAAPWALERIYTTLAPAVVGALRVQGASEPEDLTSEVFVGVLRNISQFEGDEARFRSWVFTIAYRRLADERRRRGRAPVVDSLEDVTEPLAPVDVEADVDRSFASARIRELCAALAPDQRDVLMLRLFGRLTIEEVARTLGKSVGAVKSLQHRGFVAIARELGRERVQR